MAEPQIIYLDIETAPSRGWFFDMWAEGNIIEEDQDWFILSFAVRTEGGKTRVYALPDYKGYRRNKINDRALISDLWDVLNEADIVIAHNGDNFDLKKINARFAVHGFKPPRPYRTIDTLKIARKHFKFNSNRLGSLARYLGVGKKLSTHGKDTWLGCINGDMDAWKILKPYNANDVDILVPVYQILSAWATNLPDQSAYVGDDGRCPRPTCRSRRLQKRGTGISGSMEFQRYQCMSCGHWRRGAGKRVVTMQ